MRLDEWGQNYLATSRFSRFFGTDTESDWGMSNIGKGEVEGLSGGVGLHWMPSRAGHDFRLIRGPGLPATHFLERAFDATWNVFSAQVKAINARLAEMAQDYCNGNRYERTHRSKIAEAEANPKEFGRNLGKNFDQYLPNSAYAGRRGLGGLNRVETTDIRQGLLQAGMTEKQSRTALKELSRMGSGEIKQVDNFFVQRAKQVPGRFWNIDAVVGDSRTGRVIGFVEAGVSDFRMSDNPSYFRLNRTGGEFGGGSPRIAMYLRGTSMIRFYAEEQISAGLTAAANEAWAMWTQVAEEFKAEYLATADALFHTDNPGRSKWRSNTDKDFNPYTNIRVSASIPPSPEMAEEQFYYISVYTAHPVATAHNWGLRGAAGGAQSVSMDEMESFRERFGPEPSWRYKEYS